MVEFTSANEIPLAKPTGTCTVCRVIFCGRQFGICERCQILASNLMQEALQVPWWSQSRGCCKLHKIWCRLYRRESDQVSCSSCFTLNFTLFHTCFTFTLPNFPSLCHGLPRFAAPCWIKGVIKAWEHIGNRSLARRTQGRGDIGDTDSAYLETDYI